MKFIVNTKPLSDALNLGVINANVSKFYSKSCLAQVTADKHMLKINLEAAFILSEIKLKGAGDSDSTTTIFVDSLLLKQLVSTFESSTVTLEFTDGGLILHSGKSRFTLPKLMDEVDLELAAPELPDHSSEPIAINKDDWKFIKENQMYAIAMSFIHPVYTKVWVGNDGDVLVGDFDNSLFTHSKKSKLDTTCLLSDTIINLFNSLPEGANLIKSDKSYLINVVTDGFEYISQFTPQYESDEDVGSYNADIILGMMNPSKEFSVVFSAPAVNKFLSQAALISSSSDDVIKLSIADGQLLLEDKNVQCKVAVTGDVVEPYSVEFKTVLLKSVISNYSEDVNISPMMQEDSVVGITVWNKDLTTIIAGVD